MTHPGDETRDYTVRTRVPDDADGNPVLKRDMRFLIEHADLESRDLSLSVITCYTYGNMTGSAARFGGSPGPVLFVRWEARVRRIEVKPFLPYAQQVDLLIERGMLIADRQHAERQLATLNYYRLSGYWHSMRQIDLEKGMSLNAFRPGSSFELAVELYRFDERLRQVVFADLSSIELAMRALIGYHLGAIDPLIHLDSRKLGAPARQRTGKTASTHHEIWLAKYENAVKIHKKSS